ncbi:transposase [Mucilaginibacter arboris]|uniref:transposase n=1 Tax=Mucilaginibacter arboris TaxID=2682090 RepID=UPI0018DD2F26|nr:transposase [Mucilaginibacter arboris]
MPFWQPGPRTICTALRFCGLGTEKAFHKYHRFLSRTKWGGPKASRILLGLLAKNFCRPDGPLVFGIDETIERRRGAKIKAKGIYRGSVRPSHYLIWLKSG